MVTSIVIVHGLGGDAYTTWTADNRMMWPRDFIPQVIPTARVMTFGYDSKWAFSPSTADIKDFSLDLLNRLRNKRWSAEVRHQDLYIISTHPSDPGNESPDHVHMPFARRHSLQAGVMVSL